MRERVHILDCIILILFIIAIVFSTISHTSTSLIVNADGSEYRFPLREDGIYEVEGALGTTTIEIRNGKVRFLSSPCPNKTCISNEFSNTVVCLPNKVIATVYGDMEEVDAIAR